MKFSVSAISFAKRATESYAQVEGNKFKSVQIRMPVVCIVIHTRML
jgi:hypothetical protein